MRGYGSAAEVQAGGSAIIAVKLASAASFAIDQCATGKLADAGAFLEELDFEPEQHARLDRLAEFRAFDRHEVDQLAGSCEAERFDCEDAGGLCQRFDNAERPA